MLGSLVSAIVESRINNESCCLEREPRSTLGPKYPVSLSQQYHGALLGKGGLVRAPTVWVTHMYTTRPPRGGHLAEGIPLDDVPPGSIPTERPRARDKRRPCHWLPLRSPQLISTRRPQFVPAKGIVGADSRDRSLRVILVLDYVLARHSWAPRR